MTERPVPLSLQKRMLQSLGFGFLAEAAVFPEAEVEAPPVVAAPRPRAAERPAAKPAHTEAMPSVGFDDLNAMIRGCTRCDLQFSRKCAVPGTGVAGAELFIIAELPAAEEDASGEALRGELGMMLTKMIGAMKYKPEEVFVTHAVKCRSLGGRAPREPEVAACTPYLLRQIELVGPKAIISFGPSGLWSLLPNEASQGLAVQRGKWLEFRGIPVLATYPLSYIHNNADRKRIVWQDMQSVMGRFDRS